MLASSSVKSAWILASSSGSAFSSAGVEQRDDLLRAGHVRREVPEVGLGVAVLLAGDLALGDLLDQLRGALGHGQRRDLELGDLGLERGEVAVELVGVLRGAVGGVLLPQQVLEAVPAGELRVVRAGEVVHARVDRAVDRLDQAGDGLDAPPTTRGSGRRRPWRPGCRPRGPRR